MLIISSSKLLLLRVSKSYIYLTVSLNLLAKPHFNGNGRKYHEVLI